ncbi:hypothetical protein [Amycolatopsis sp. NPDC051128]|uniref:hypothetical protein n=1 Tax=Amycolatopsis sp. NPDC051128 TaxID=3155412 RepID=UPI003412752F
MGPDDAVELEGVSGWPAKTTVSGGGAMSSTRPAATAFGTLGQPDATRLGVTALNMPDKQFIWLDDPDSDHCWPPNSDS